MGTTHSTKRTGSAGADGDDGDMISPPHSPMSGGPSSPLSYTPQYAGSIAPDASFSAAEFSAWPTQSKVVPTVIVWSHDGEDVEVEGSFDNWTSRTKLQRSGKDFTIVKLLPPGVYQYKYIVDGQWRYDPNLPAIYDDDLNVNNVLEVLEYVPENLAGLSDFDPPPSPRESYDDAAPTQDDYKKEPPAVPPHLALTLLNVPPAIDSQALLPRPGHAVLNHLYVQRSSEHICATVVGTTTRYKNKYITSVMYKPRKKVSSNPHRAGGVPASAAAPGAHVAQQAPAPAPGG